MAYVATQRIKHNGTWYAPGTPLPRLSKAERAYFDANRLGVEQVTAAEAEAVRVLQAKVADLAAAAAADAGRANELRGDLEALGAAFADLPNLRRAATNAAKGEDEQAKAATAAAVEAAEAAQRQHAETMAEIQALEASAAAKRAALEALS